MHRSSLLVSLIALLALSACDNGGAFEATESDGSGGQGGESLPDAGNDEDGAADADAMPPDPCPPPADPKKSALCLTIEPEAIDFIATNPRFDGQGILHVALFDNALPGNGAPLQDRTLPPQGGDLVTKSLTELVAEPIRFELDPGTIYPRVLFFDDLNVFEDRDEETLLPGLWLGGFDLSKGLVATLPLQPVVLEAGEGREVAVKLVALRQLTVNVSRADNLEVSSNAQGPIFIAALDSPSLGGSPKAFGLAEKSCGDLSVDGSSVAVEGVVVGEGPYWVTAILDDYGVGLQPNSLPGGALLSVASGSIAESDKLSYAPTAYRAAMSIALKISLIPPQDKADVSCSDPG